MTEEEKQELWRSLHRLDRKISYVGSMVITGVVGGLAWYGYQVIPDTWGISGSLAGWVAFALWIGVSIYFERQLRKL
jgi:TRAP-type C4-dicarboxylate transport system permease small subunit